MEKSKEKSGCYTKYGSTGDTTQTSIILKNLIIENNGTFEEKVKLNKKKILKLKLEEYKTYIEEIIKYIKKIIPLHQELINKTEYWEKKSTVEFDFDNWNKIKRIRGSFTKYLNDCILIKLKIERELNEKNSI